tara:strand:+ start:325 stop:753 length:429 start_codon:yes stop_codon:yes gene_type:complete
MSEIKVDTLTGKTTANDITVTVGATATAKLEQGLAKGWMKYDQYVSGTAIDDSFNVASSTDNSAGNFYQNHTNIMGNANYATLGISGHNNVSVHNQVNSQGTVSSPLIADTTSKAAYISRVCTNATAIDMSTNTLVVIGDLA